MHICALCILYNFQLILAPNICLLLRVVFVPNFVII
nr:MAG TPA: hypothetical protein [Caudoviricetes sp.]